MLVQPKEDFIKTRGTNVPIKALDKRKKYEVILEVRSRFGRVSLLVVDEMHPDYPTAWPEELFLAVDDNRLGWATSRHVPGFPGTVSGKEAFLQILKRDPYYVERLVDGEGEAVSKFKEIFPNSIR